MTMTVTAAGITVALAGVTGTGTVTAASDAAVPGAMSAPIVGIGEADVSTAASGATAVKTAISPAAADRQMRCPRRFFCKLMNNFSPMAL